MRKFKLESLFLVLLLTTLTATFPLQAGTVNVVGRILPGETRNVYVRGDYAYINAGRSIMTVDVSDPTDVRQRGLVDLPFVSGSGIYNIQTQENHLYLSYGTGGLRIFDLSDPVNPRLIGNFDGFVMGLFVRGPYVYLTSIRRVLIVDVSVPSSPALVSSLECSDVCFGNYIWVDGNYAYVTYATLNGFNGLRIIDVSQPANPAFVGQLPSQEAYGVVARGNYAYIANGAAGLRVADVSDPAHPIFIAQRAQEAALGLFVIGNLLYVMNYGNMRIFDVSDPFVPVELSSIRTTGTPWRVFVRGDYAHLVDVQGLNILDVSDPTRPILIDFLATRSPALDTFVQGEYAYVADPLTNGGLRIVDISDPESTKQVVMEPSASSRRVIVRDQIAYLTDHLVGLRTLDVSTPSNPMPLGTLSRPGFSPGAIALKDNYAYITSDAPPLLQIVDISEPSRPLAVGSTLVGRASNDVALEGDYAYVAAGPDGLKVIDVSDPSSPKEIAALVREYAQGVYVKNHFAYMADAYRDIYSEFSGLRIVDVSDPRNPTPVGALHIGGRPNSVLVEDNLAYVANYDPRYALKIIDVADPSNPTEVGSFTLHTAAEHVFISNGWIYLATAFDGTYILDFVP